VVSAEAAPMGNTPNSKLADKNTPSHLFFMVKPPNPFYSIPYGKGIVNRNILFFQNPLQKRKDCSTIMQIK
jgi:hypothetical protein